MSTPIFECQAVFEDSAFSLLARIHANGANVVQANVSAISIKVYDLAAPTVLVGSELTPSAASVIYNTLQTDARWSRDNVGYNFRYDVADTILPAGGKVYRIKVKMTPTTGSPYHWVCDVPTRTLPVEIP